MVRSARDPVETDHLPRICELVAHSIALASPWAYFQAGDDKLTNPAKRPFFVAIERDLQGLDREAWAVLKAEALPRLAARAPGRGWQELFSVLNQARGYTHLAAIGCDDVQFIPRTKGKTPDLRATLGRVGVLCEVKTIHISAAEVARRLGGGVGTTQAHVTPEFLVKLRRAIETARDQMVAFDATASHIAYVVVNFDDLLHEYARECEAQIMANLTADPPRAVEAVLDIKPPFHAATRSTLAATTLKAKP